MALGDPVLDRLALLPLDDDVHWHVFATLYPPGAPLAVQAVNPNPRSQARYSRVAAGVGMFYVACKERTAFWETVLQHASIEGDGSVTLHPSHRHDQAIVRLQRDTATPIACLDLRSPHRYRVVDQNTARDREWMASLIVVGNYLPTHEPAENAHRQFAAAGETMHAIVYPSRKYAEDYAAVYYVTPGSTVPWTVAAEPYRLDTDVGETRLADLLWEDGFTWIGDPAADPDAQPEPGAL